MSLHIGSLGALAAFAMATLGTSHASAFCRMTTNDQAQVGNAPCTGDGVPLEWENACVMYHIDSRGSLWLSQGDVEDAISASFSAWEEVSCQGEPPNVVFKMGEPSMCQESQFNEGGVPNVNTVAFLSDWEFDRRAFAVTIVWFRQNGRILDADVLINDTLGPYDLCPDTGCPPGTNANPGPADIQSIVTHEVGHILGIGHSEDPSATMFAEAPREEVQKRTLGQDDIEAVCTIYPPGNLNSSCDATPVGGLDLNCEDDPPEPMSSGGGCSSTTIDTVDTPVTTLALALLVVMVMRRRSSHHVERS